jgi:hypothetical protein
MNARVDLIGLAIVSADDCIADARGEMPEGLRNEADWAYFQNELDRADITLLGRIGHERHPNDKQRRRLVVSSSATGLEVRPDGWWWNPADCDWNEVTARLMPRGGRVAVPGGRRVFDLCLALGYCEFHLSRAERCLLPGGVKLFTACAQKPAADVLAEAGLQAAPAPWLDDAAGVSTYLWSTPENGIHAL